MHADEAEVGQLLNTLRGDGQIKCHTGSEEAFDIFKGNEESLHDSRAMAPEKPGHFTEHSEGQASFSFKQSLAIEGRGYPEMQRTAIRQCGVRGQMARRRSIIRSKGCPYPLTRMRLKVILLAHLSTSQLPARNLEGKSMNCTCILQKEKQAIH